MTITSTTPPKRHRILIVDDHPIVRHGIAQVIQREADLEVCGEAADIAETLRQVETSCPEVVIIDLSLERESGLKLIEQIKTRWPNVKMLVSSTHDEQTFAGRVLRAGAMGYVGKRETINKVVEALRRVLRGEIYLSAEMTTRLLQRAAVGTPLDLDPVETLSDRELQVFGMIGRGLTTPQIAGALQLSSKTVESYRKMIKTKLKLKNSIQLSRCAFQWVQENH